MPSLPADPDQMKVLVGRWTGGGEVFANPFGPAGRSQGTWDFRMDGPGLHLVNDYHEVRDDGHVFQGHGIFAIDPATSEFLWYWFDSYGHPPLFPARGQWSNAVLQLEKTTPRGIGRTRFELRDGKLVQDVETRLTGSEGFISITHAVFNRAQDVER